MSQTMAEYLKKQSDEYLWELEECIEREFSRRRNLPKLSDIEIEQLSISRMETIKMYRARIGCSLKEAKRVVDNTQAWLDEQKRLKR